MQSNKNSSGASQTPNQATASLFLDWILCVFQLEKSGTESAAKRIAAVLLHLSTANLVIEFGGQ